MGKSISRVVRSVTNSIRGSVKDPFGQISKDFGELTGLNKGAEATAAAAQQASLDAERQRAQFEASAKALAAQQSLATNNTTDNVVQVEQGANRAYDLGMGTSTSKKKKGNTLSLSLGL